MSAAADVPRTRRRRRLGIALGVAGSGLALAALLLGPGRRAVYERLVAWLGPPEVSAAEAYRAASASEASVRFDHGALGRVLARFVDEEGFVDYAGLARDPDALDGYVASLGEAPFDALDRNGKLALLLNAYNAFTLRLILDYWPVDSIMDIPERDRWRAARWRLAGRTLSLDALENEELRKKFVEPRIHFAINCASVGCPPLSREPFDAPRLDAQLDAAAARLHRQGGRWIDFDPSTGALGLTQLYLWYRTDFERVAGSHVRYAARYHEGLARHLREAREVDLRWLPYDWRLNATRPE